MSMRSVARHARACVLLLLIPTADALAQTPPASPAHQHPAAAPAASPWRFMQDGVVYGVFNRQGGPRGGREFIVPNWWMGMLTRDRGSQQFGLTAMLSLDPATLGKDGYREIFQIGETLNGEPLVDRQHPHDFLMQLAASWRTQPTQALSFTLAGGLAGEPTLGPVAFMHRPSAAGIILAPLGHHTFDSTHITFGVVTASAAMGKWVVEGSVFNAREPDEERWDLDLAHMDSGAARVWFRPTPEVELQVSSGYLHHPEPLEPGNVVRTTASAAFYKPDARGFLAFTLGYGVNDHHGDRLHGVFGEVTREFGRHSLSARAEMQQVEAGKLRDAATSAGGGGPVPAHFGPPVVIDGEDVSHARVNALTLGATRRLAQWRGFEGAAGATVTFYGARDGLDVTHGSRPVSFQVFLRLRLPTGGSMGRMWNMRMSQGHPTSSHAGHQMSPTASR